MVSVPIVAETCARRGAGFSRFLQLVPGEGESQTTGKLCVLHFLYKGIGDACAGSEVLRQTAQERECCFGGPAVLARGPALFEEALRRDAARSK